MCVAVEVGFAQRRAVAQLENGSREHIQKKSTPSSNHGMAACYIKAVYRRASSAGGDLSPLYGGDAQKNAAAFLHRRCWLGAPRPALLMMSL